MQPDEVLALLKRGSAQIINQNELLKMKTKIGTKTGIQLKLVPSNGDLENLVVHLIVLVKREGIVLLFM